jgi:hypothetical protein
MFTHIFGVRSGFVLSDSPERPPFVSALLQHASRYRRVVARDSQKLGDNIVRVIALQLLNHELRIVRHIGKRVRTHHHASAHTLASHRTAVEHFELHAH